MTNLDIYFSDACNANCSYCPILSDTNDAIRQALEDNTFVTNVRHVLTPDIKSIGFWGREPSINGKYFNNFISNLLDYDPYIHYIIIPTNGQSDNFYNDFIRSLYTYCTLHKRKIIMMIQFSLDGPPDLHDKYYTAGSANKCLDSIEYIYKNFNFKNEYLRLRISTKSTLRGYEIEHYSPQKWSEYMFNLFLTYDPKTLRNGDCKIGQQLITLEVPGNYTVSQGQALSRWKQFIRLEPQYYHSCAINDNKTIDYLGNLYDCHLLVNKDKTQQQLFNEFNETMNELVQANEAIEQDREQLFNAISSIYCWGASNRNFDSYIRLLGNGFLL